MYLGGIVTAIRSMGAAGSEDELFKGSVTHLGFYIISAVSVMRITRNDGQIYIHHHGCSHPPHHTPASRCRLQSGYRIMWQVLQEHWWAARVRAHPSRQCHL